MQLKVSMRTMNRWLLFYRYCSCIEFELCNQVAEGFGRLQILDWLVIWNPGSLLVLVILASYLGSGQRKKNPTK